MQTSFSLDILIESVSSIRGNGEIFVIQFEQSGIEYEVRRGKHQGKLAISIRHIL